MVWLTEARTFMLSFSDHREVDVRQPIAVLRIVMECNQISAEDRAKVVIRHPDDLFTERSAGHPP